MNIKLKIFLTLWVGKIHGPREKSRKFWTIYGNEGHCGREEPREFSDLVRARDEDQLMPQDHHLLTKKQLQKKINI